jgi:hypothetical protein
MRTRQLHAVAEAQPRENRLTLQLTAHECKKLLKNSVHVGCLAVALGGCSVGMAMSGSDNPDLGAVRVGATRGEVQMQLGSPVRTTTLPDGTRTDLYEYEIGNEPSAARAMGHGVMDVLTLGAWEIIGTPVEGFQGEKYQATITYGQDDKVIQISSNKQ